MKLFLWIWVTIATVLRPDLAEATDSGCLMKFINQTNGVVQAPKSNSGEPILCQWYIERVTSDHVIHLTFDLVDLPTSNTGSSSDALLLYGYVNKQRQRIVTGNNNTAGYFESHHDIWITLFMKSTKGHRGVRVYFEQIKSWSNNRQTTCIVALAIFGPLLCLFPVYVHWRRKVYKNSGRRQSENHLARMSVVGAPEISNSNPEISLCGLCNINTTQATEMSEFQVYDQVHGGVVEAARRKSEVSLTVHRLSSIQLDDTSSVLKPFRLDLLDADRTEVDSCTSSSANEDRGIVVTVATDKYIDEPTSGESVSESCSDADKTDKTDDEPNSVV